uniref:Uncharacterized protein n=1 Tax=Amphimedon queenslandica TaxID=400682 RepID=A0A1X7V6M3_AMPQE
MATASSSSSSGTTAPSRIWRNLYKLIEDDTYTWLKRRGVIGDFTDEDCGKCGNGRMRLTADKFYSNDRYCWKCTSKVYTSKLRIIESQVLLLTCFWVYKFSQENAMSERVIASKHTVYDWYNFLHR